VAAAAVIVMDAVTLVEVTVPIVPVTPLLPEVTALAADRFVPAKVTVKVEPAAPLFGVTEVSVGVAAFTVKGTVRCELPTVRPRVVAPVAAVEVMVIEAVTLVAVAVPIVPVTPVLPEVTALAADRFVPAKVTVKVEPAAPLFGVTDVSVGVAAFTVKGTESCVLPTESPRLPAPTVAVEAMVIEAVTLVALVVPIVPVTPVIFEVTAVAPDRFVPAKVTLKVVPAVPLFGVTDVSVGVAAFTVKGTETCVPPTESPRVPAPTVAVEAMVIEAVTLVAVAVPVIVPVTPEIFEVTAVAPDRFVPAKVTLKVLPTAPLFGVTDVSVGAPEVVKEKL
jgi:hypothetical protein